MKRSVVFLLVMSVLGPAHSDAQVNTWSLVDSGSLGSWFNPALTYAASTGKFTLTLGTPAVAVEPFRVSVFSQESPAWSDVASANLVKPSVRQFSNPYTQFCLNPDDGKIYFYVRNSTFSYDPATRLWDTLVVNTHPNKNAEIDAQTFLKWGSLCYDPVNREFVLFGGCGLDAPQGSPYTWTLDCVTKTWSKLNLSVQPPPRANSPMVYDPATRKIYLFGGDHMDYLMNDTWAYDCATRAWSKRNPAIRPRPRAGHAFFRLPQSGALVLMGGYRYLSDQRYEFEMWRYDPARDDWACIRNIPSSERWPKVLFYNPGFGSVAAAGPGDTVVALGVLTPSRYTFSPLTYRMNCDASVTDAAATLSLGLARDTLALRTDQINYDPAWYSQGLAAPDTGSNEAFHRNITAGTWVTVPVPKLTTGPHDWGTKILDPGRGIIVNWAGGHACYNNTDVPQYSIPGNRWALGFWPEVPLEYGNGSELAPGPLSFNDRPFMPCHTVKSYAYDAKLRKMVFAGSMGRTHLYDPDSLDWDRRTLISNPAVFPRNYMGLYNTGLCSTPRGVYCLANSQSWMFDSDSLCWRLLPQNGIALPLYYADDGGVVYDSKRDRILYFTGGNNSKPKCFEYLFSAGRAARLFPADSEKSHVAVNYWRELAYLPNSDVVLTQMPTGASTMLAYDCGADRWIDFPAANCSMISGRSLGLMYDPVRNLVFLTEGRGNLWALRPDSGKPASAGAAGILKSPCGLAASPNPFNPAVLFSFTPSRPDGSAFLSVMDLNGRTVWARSLSWKSESRPLHCEWDASGMASGSFIVRVREGMREWSRRVTLLR